MVGAPVIIKHQDVTDENADELRCGVISKAYFNELDGWYYAEGIIWDTKAQELINNKDWSVSCSYDFLSYNDEGGVENNIKYDKEFTSLNFTHLALVNNPRYERANIVFNSKIDNYNENHYPANSLDGKGGQFAPKNYSKYFSDKRTGMSYYDDVLFDRDYAEHKQRFSKIITMTPDKYLEVVTKGFNEGHKKYESGRTNLTVEDIVRQRTDQRLKDLREKFGKSEPFDMPMIEFQKQGDGTTDMATQEGIHRAILAKEQNLNEIPVAVYSTGRYGERFSNEELEENLKNILETEFGIKEGEQIETNKTEEEEIKNFILSLDYDLWADDLYIKTYDNDKKYIEINKNKDFYTVSTKNAETGKIYDTKKIETKEELYELLSDLKDLSEYHTNNSKEKEMSLIDEIKKLIRKVENNKETEEMIENEKTDKRKLIDEVAGIMKSAGCDDEDIRTAIGKMEKIGYDASEDSKADNKKVKNEDEEDKEEDKKEDKKEDKEVDNEDAEDKKEAEDLKEDAKEDVKNKCKNDKSSFDKINEIYNSVKTLKVKTEYETRDVKLKNAEEYFG